MKTGKVICHTSEGCTAPEQGEGEVPIFVAQIVSHVSTYAKKGLQNELVSFLTIIRSDEFYTDTFRSWISVPDSCKPIADSDRSQAILKNYGFYRTAVCIEGLQGTQVPIIHWKYIVEVLRKQMDLSDPDHIIYRSAI